MGRVHLLRGAGGKWLVRVVGDTGVFLEVDPWLAQDPKIL